LRFAALLIPALSLPLAALVTFRIPWGWRLLVVSLASLLDLLLLRSGIMVAASGLALLALPMNRLVTLPALEAIDRRLVCNAAPHGR
jgi:hypothetical protein